MSPGEIAWRKAGTAVCNSRPTCICAFCLRRNRMESPRDEQRRLASEFVLKLLKHFR
jgi:hypothetical protein